MMAWSTRKVLTVLHDDAEGAYEDKQQKLLSTLVNGCNVCFENYIVY